MPLFKCTKCGALDNTAAGGAYWGVDKDKVLCCECHTGKWHDIFPKETPEEAGYVIGSDNYHQYGGFYERTQNDK